MDAGCVEAYESVAELAERFEESALFLRGCTEVEVAPLAATNMATGIQGLSTARCALPSRCRCLDTGGLCPGELCQGLWSFGRWRACRWIVVSFQDFQLALTGRRDNGGGVSDFFADQRAARWARWWR